MIRIILVDDHSMVREALRVVLERDGDLQVVAEAEDGEAGLRLARELCPDVVVMDIQMRGPSGIEVTRRLLAADPELKVLALSTHLDRHVIEQMLDAGARGYITKGAAGDELKKGIRAVVEGRSHLCPGAAMVLAESFLNGQRGPARSGEERMSPRELEVVALIAGGLTAQEIADRLHISWHTVKAHRRHIMRKLKAANTADITRYAIRCGLTSA